ncbi:MAG: hypothetical protein GY696_14320 [Gammaproteobacteria bacterium]|nr:hypothetical protein [Gammaproteobacteria bacterium]
MTEHQAVERKVTTEEDDIQELNDDKERASVGDCALYRKLDRAKKRRKNEEDCPLPSFYRQ